jgi:hypothetical protein
VSNFWKSKENTQLKKSLMEAAGMSKGGHEVAMQGQTGIAKKVYECVPINESWQAFQICAALKKMTGSTPDFRVFTACLSDLADVGLIKKVGGDRFQRVQEAAKPEKEKHMAVAKISTPKSANEKTASAMDALGDLAGEIIGMAEHMKRLAKRVEDVALAVEQEREANAGSVEQLRQLKTLLKGL